MTTPNLTITEALAEIKTISKRLEKKRASVLQYLIRQEGIKDPLEKTGGSEAFILAESQSIRDLEQNTISLRRGIAHANDTTTLTVCGTTRTISEWLTWRREVAGGVQAHIASLRNQIAAARRQAQQTGAKVVAGNTPADAPTDYVVNLDEVKLNQSWEDLDTILTTLDGQLSKLNATTLLSA